MCFLSYTAQAQDTIVLSQDLELIPVNEHTWIHKSFMTTQEFGRISANGIVYINGKEAIVGDTPTNEEQSALLIDWLEKQKINVKAIIVNHHHMDALGGLPAFHKKSIPSYGHVLTQNLTEDPLLKPWHTFSDSMSMTIGSESVKAYYFGKGHTDGNIALWISNDQLLFGGCLIKSLRAGKGYLGDASVEDWPVTVRKIQSYFPHIKTVIPGHGKYGNKELLDATIEIIAN